MANVTAEAGGLTRLREINRRLTQDLEMVLDCLEKNCLAFEVIRRKYPDAWREPAVSQGHSVTMGTYVRVSDMLGDGGTPDGDPYRRMMDRVEAMLKGGSNDSPSPPAPAPVPAAEVPVQPQP